MSEPGGSGYFPTTRWTLIGRLRSGDESAVHRALEDLCTQYRFPLYCVIRHRGLAHHDAEDALHDFLSKLLRLDAFADADAGKGRLRSFLCSALQRFLINWHRDRAAHRREVSLDAFAPGQDDEARYAAHAFPDHETPERIFDRQWAGELLGRVLRRLAGQYEARGKSALFGKLAPVLQGGGSLRGEDTAALAGSLGLSQSGLRSAHQRFLADYRDLIEEEVSQTVASPAEVGDEIAHLLAAFRKG